MTFTKNQKIPSGRMCMACEKRDADCSALQFNVMPVIGTTKDGLITVKCLAFKALAKQTRAQAAPESVA
jgi:hypothetical protein